MLVKLVMEQAVPALGMILSKSPFVLWMMLPLYLQVAIILWRLGKTEVYGLGEKIDTVNSEMEQHKT